MSEIAKLEFAGSDDIGRFDIPELSLADTIFYKESEWRKMPVIKHYQTYTEKVYLHIFGLTIRIPCLRRQTTRLIQEPGMAYEECQAETKHEWFWVT